MVKKIPTFTFLQMLYPNMTVVRFSYLEYLLNISADINVCRLSSLVKENLKTNTKYMCSFKKNALKSIPNLIPQRSYHYLTKYNYCCTFIIQPLCIDLQLFEDTSRTSGKLFE